MPLLDLLDKTQYVSSEIQTARIKICTDCRHLFLTQCLKCGCFVALKTQLKTERCPIRKWGKEP